MEDNKKEYKNSNNNSNNIKEDQTGQYTELIRAEEDAALKKDMEPQKEKEAATAPISLNTEPGEDPIRSQEAPFSYHMGQRESVILSNGTLQYNVTDFVLPGRNGFDLNITRHYNSDNAGLYNMKPISPSRGVFTTGRRENDHNLKMYGLGFGWSFVLPSIEVVPESEQDTRNFIYYPRLHLEDGRKFEIHGNDLSDHPLRDVIIYSQAKGNITHPYRSDVIKSYDITVAYRNGNKDYFQKVYDSNDKLDCYKLVVRQDRFGNTICFTLAGSNGMTIVDTWGRNIVLSASGNTMTWTMPDSTPAQPRRITYTINDRRLTQLTDQENRVARYEYYNPDVYKAVSSFALVGHGDTSNLEFPFLLLKRIAHPTGAFTEYEYGTTGDPAGTLRLEINEMGGFRQYYPIHSRRDIARGVISNVVGYTFELSSDRKYIKQAKVQRLLGVLEQHTFNDQNQLIEQEIRHSGALVLSGSYEYGTDEDGPDYKLLVSEDTKQYNPQSSQYLQKLTRLEYTEDKRANVTKITETYPDDTALNQETNLFYGAYSIITEKNYKKDDATTIYERYTLRSHPDNKVVGFKKVYEGTELKEKTQYIYGTTDNDRYCVTQERRYYTGSGESLEKSGSFYATNFSYDSSKYTHAPVAIEITEIVDADGNLIDNIRETFDYDPCGRVVSRTDGNKHTTNIAYDGLGRVVKEIYPAVEGRRHSKLIHYNDTNNFITTTDENLFKQRLEYTPLGQLERVLLASGNESGAGDILLLQNEYDAIKRKIRERTYDGNGETINNVKATAVYEYDSFDRITSRSVPEINYLETHKYIDVYPDPDEPGRKYFFHQKTVSGEGAAAPDLITAIYADQLGQVCKEFSGGTRIATNGYDKLGNRISLLDARGKRTLWTYDYAGRLISVTRWLNGNAQTSRTEYDDLGNIKYRWDNAGNQTEFYHDAAGRLVRQVFPFDIRRAITKNYYDPAGNLTWKKVKQGERWRETEQRYDARNRQTEVLLYSFKNPNDLIGARWIRTVYQYDGVGNPVEIRTGYTETSNGYARIRYTYDRLRNVLTMTDAQRKVERYRYDNTGVLESKIDRNGNRMAYLYDVLDRMVKESVTVNNSKGHLTSERETIYTRTGAKRRRISREIENGQSASVLTIEYSYNNRGELVRQGDPDGVVKEYTYDPSGNRQTFKLFRNNTTSPEIFLHYAYDDLNRLQRVRKDGATGMVVVEYSYDINGNRSMMRYPGNNIETVYSYNGVNLVTLLENRRNGIRVSGWEYTYLLDSNLASVINKTMDNHTIKYQYDGIGRLVQERDSSWNTIAYEYDQYSNRAKMIVSGLENYVTIYEYQLNNLLLRESKKQGQVTEILSYRYDDNGNQIYREWEKISPISTEPGKVYFQEKEQKPAILDMREYNGFNQLVKANRFPVDILYQYRPDGLRHSKIVANSFIGTIEKTIHHWNGLDIVMEATGGNIKARYLRGINLVAQQIGNFLYYYLYNMRGDVVQHVDENSNSMYKYEYDAFGNERNPNSNDPNPFRYCGEYWDLSSDTYYLRARNYDPAIGRFTQPDPIKDGINWYVYCDNNPVMRIDPSGLFWRPPWVDRVQEGWEKLQDVNDQLLRNSANRNGCYQDTVGDAADNVATNMSTQDVVLVPPAVTRAQNAVLAARNTDYQYVVDNAIKNVQAANIASLSGVNPTISVQTFEVKNKEPVIEVGTGGANFILAGKSGAAVTVSAEYGNTSGQKSAMGFNAYVGLKGINVGVYLLAGSLQRRISVPFKRNYATVGFGAELGLSFKNYFIDGSRTFGGPINVTFGSSDEQRDSFTSTEESIARNFNALQNRVLSTILHRLTGTQNSIWNNFLRR